MGTTVGTRGPVEMLREPAVKEAVWGCATYFFELTHAGAGAVVEWTYRAVQVVLVARPVQAGSGYDVTVDALPTPMASLRFAFRVRELPAGSALLPQGGVLLDITYLAVPDDEAARPWHDFRSRIASADPDTVLEHVTIQPPGTALAALPGVSRTTTHWALRVALDHTGTLAALGMRRGDAPA
ncbi:hypothetical protein [Actinoplanes sp. NPDC049265]|uniref:hypothetical protein n=1 Tax=Actinoplanes sp. NPDC049265 TaxID=3363902 RepID=UPI00371B5ECE